MNYHHVYFLKSALKKVHFPVDTGKEVAFLGRSNAGKSSALNALVGQRQLARASRTPGRTQCINFFCLDDQRRLVDLPGYGYARVPLAMKNQWKILIDDYLCCRKSLCGLIMIIDIRRSLKEFEETLLLWAQDRNLPVHLLLTKADKLSKNAQAHALSVMQKEMRSRFLDSQYTVSLFSAKVPIGRETLQERLDQWLS